MSHVLEAEYVPHTPLQPSQTGGRGPVAGGGVVPGGVVPGGVGAVPFGSGGGTFGGGDPVNWVNLHVGARRKQMSASMGYQTASENGAQARAFADCMPRLRSRNVTTDSSECMKEPAAREMNWDSGKHLAVNPCAGMM
jgi:hypothetical protein